MKYFLILFIAFSCAQNCRAWGFFAHKWINQIAVFTLPSEIYPFYRNHINEIRDRATNPDMRRYVVENEGSKHYLDIDHYEHSAPLDSIPHNYGKALITMGKDSLWEHGVGPWNVIWTYNKLVKAFENHDETSIVNLSADLGHYVADLHVPLHTTSNYNGQLTGQHGIHGLWESRLPELFFDEYDLILETAGYVPNVEGRIWRVVEDSYSLLDSVFNMEKLCTDEVKKSNKFGLEYRSSALVEVYSRTFCLCYSQNLSGMVERRMRASATNVGEFWYSAWVDAGQPTLPEPNTKDSRIKLSPDSLLTKARMLGRPE